MRKLKINFGRLLMATWMLLAFMLPFAPALAARNLNDAFKSDANSPLGSTAGMAGYETEPSKTSVENLIATIIQTLLSFLGVIFLLLIIYGGYNWMTAAGDNSKVELAKNTITRATIGLVVVIGAYAISYFVITYLGANTLNQSTLK